MKIASYTALATFLLLGRAHASPSPSEPHAGSLHRRDTRSRHHRLGRSIQERNASPAPASPGIARGMIKRRQDSTLPSPAYANATSSSLDKRVSPWQLRKTHQEWDFFNNWQFWSWSDPTHGAVEYVTKDVAMDRQLTTVKDGLAMMYADTTESGVNRKAVRITDTSYTFNLNTLLIMDSTHMPTGCGTWPAFWANGPEWPKGGEIDIVEGVHNQAQNQATLHTTANCAISDSKTTSTGGPAYSGTVLGHSCDVTAPGSDNSGCGFKDTNANSFGAGFNSIGGGVYAMEYVASGISVWFFPRNRIPADIGADTPDPWSWGSPMAHWGSDTCQMDGRQDGGHFYDISTIINLTFCGDWAGNAWVSSGCAAQTKTPTCTEYVKNNPGAFKEAYWAIKYVKYYGF